eukprot:s473_g30.t1
MEDTGLTKGCQPESTATASCFCWTAIAKPAKPEELHAPLSAQSAAGVWMFVFFSATGERCHPHGTMSCVFFLDVAHDDGLRIVFKTEKTHKPSRNGDMDRI